MLRNADKIIEKLKEFEWTFADGNNIGGKFTNNGWTFYKDRVLAVRHG